MFTFPTACHLKKLAHSIRATQYYICGVTIVSLRLTILRIYQVPYALSQHRDTPKPQMSAVNELNIQNSTIFEFQYSVQNHTWIVIGVYGLKELYTGFILISGILLETTGIE